MVAHGRRAGDLLALALRHPSRVAFIPGSVSKITKAGATITVEPAEQPRLRALALAIGGDFAIRVVDVGPDRPLLVDHDEWASLLKYVSQEIAQPYIVDDPLAALRGAADAGAPIGLIAEQFEANLPASLVLRSLTDEPDLWNAWAASRK